MQMQDSNSNLPPSQGCSIQLQDVNLAIDGRSIIKQLSFHTQVKRLGIIGRNGSGKSTLSRLCSGLIKTTSGSLHVANINPYKDRKGALKQIGILFQNPDNQIIFPTVIEEIMFGLRQLGQTKQQARASALATLADFGKSHWEEAHTSALSQGQKHLLCLMAIVAMQPQLIILDEPFAGLDIPTKLQLKRYLAQFAGSLVHISHDPDDLVNYDQLLWLEDGEINALGSPEDVLPSYKTAMYQLGDGDDISNLAS